MHDSGMQPFELRGDGVLLAVPTLADVDAITERCRDDEVRRWTTVPDPYDRSDAEEFVRLVDEAWADDKAVNWAVRNPEDRSLLGMVGLNLDGRGSGEIGYWMGREGRGLGLMTTAVRLVVEYAFAPEGLGLQRVLWYAHVGNWPSRRLVWRLGFTVEGTIRSHLTQRGERRDAWAATLLASDAMTPKHPWFAVPTLAGSKVTLRRLVESDADACVEACNDPVSRHWLSGLPDPYTRDVALGYIRSRENEHAAGTSVHWAAEHPGGSAAIGAFSLMNISDGHAEVGYWVHPAARGTGVATEAVQLMSRYALTAKDEGGLGLRRLTLARAEGNDASGTVAERAGFSRFGVGSSAERLGDGSWVDLRWYELLAAPPTAR
jgi:RimJ/RimL family protein N-acetyltransferase